MANNKLLQYKGYSARPEYSVEDRIFYGKILGIDDLVNFMSDKAGDIEKEFHEAVDDYLEFCKEIGKEPQKAYKGSFNVRVSPELHKQLAVCAAMENISLNHFVENALQNAVARQS